MDFVFICGKTYHKKNNCNIFIETEEKKLMSITLKVTKKVHLVAILKWNGFSYSIDSYEVYEEDVLISTFKDSKKGRRLLPWGD